ncbi:hypothetical protein SEA_MORGANA_164 [Gordonia phage Morgana]|uniref:Uncharacterized protein n=1 Tax=Gordonia phage Morgana TaxID=3137292 RepID=A0AAX4RB68_9CAUD
MSVDWSTLAAAQVDVIKPMPNQRQPSSAGAYVLAISHEGSDGIAIEGSLADFDALVETIQAKLAAARAEVADRVQAKLAAAREEQA